MMDCQSETFIFEVIEGNADNARIYFLEGFRLLAYKVSITRQF